MSRKGIPLPTPWESLDHYPPCFVRLQARTGPGCRTWRDDAEVAILSGIDINRVREIARTTFRNVTNGETRAFCAACGFDPTSGKDRARIKLYERACRKRNVTPYKYLKRHPKWESEILPLIKLMQSQLQSAAA